MPAQHTGKAPRCGHGLQGGLAVGREARDNRGMKSVPVLLETCAWR